MIVIPAIDIHNGQCVRLEQGDPTKQTVYSRNATKVALKWAAAGARWLHIVNLDGAFGYEGEARDNLLALQKIIKSTNIPVQMGGGLRSLDDIVHTLEMGVQRVVLGTVAITQPNLVAEAVRRFGPECIVAGIDARDGLVATHGWKNISPVTALSLAQQLKEMGIRIVVHTDIARDGMLLGPNADASARLADTSGLDVIISGGIGSMADLEALRERNHPQLIAVIIGKALYNGAIDLKEAIAFFNNA